MLAEPGTPYGRLALAGLLGLAAAAATIGLLAGSGYVVGRAALRPGLSAIVGILAAVEVLAFLRGPLRYEERLVGHDAALRALTGWRVWLYDCLTPRVPAALAGWRSGDLLARAIDDVDALQDLYLRTLLPVAVAVGACAIGTAAVGFILPWAALALGIPLLVALTVPAALTWRRSGDDEMAALSGTLSAQVVDALQGAPELLAFGADGAALDAVEALGRRSDALERHHARLATVAATIIAGCLAVALAVVLALGVDAVHAGHLGQVMVAVLPLTVLATFEMVPGVPAAVARSLTVRASADRLFALEDVEIPVRDTVAPVPLGKGVPAVAFEDAQRALRAGPAPGPRRRRPEPAPRGPGRRHRFERCRQVDPRHCAPALLAARGWHALTGRGGRGCCSPSTTHAPPVHWPTSEPRCSPARCAPICCSRIPTPTRSRSPARCGPLASTRGWRRCRRGSTHPWARTGSRSRAASADASRWPAPSSHRAPWSSSTNPPAGSISSWPTKCSKVCCAAAGERSVLVITHRVAEARLCDVTLTLEAGRVVPPQA